MFDYTEKEFHRREYQICKATGKRCYSEREANVQLSSVRKNYNKHHYNRKLSRKSATGKIPKRKYFCRDCGMYHLTSSAVSKEDRYKKRHSSKKSQSNQNYY